MRRLLFTAGLLVGTSHAIAYGQSAGAPSGPTPDISKSDMAAHDTATQPSNLDALRNGVRSNDFDRTAERMREKLGPARPATAKELIAGAPINDNTGVGIATVVSVDADGVTVGMGSSKVKVPANAFGHNRVGLMLDMTKAAFEKLVAGAS
ncbi:hypothetical protein HMF7854_09610 [Sphingomonas ginkgonis]|uniref:Uncharacterized protein n=1 Tax=Sphingomonas ginkgonis TaxID=2315330 RepID=A0A429VAV4_9SPHN|nr:hypothetical protein [Sphingomonas ginkgonis]RST31065.1 hypothetical protein HMF7854_09610 [Sphingomonas ginkgonis]